MSQLLASMLRHMPVEVRFQDQELAERYSDSKRTAVVGSEKFFLHGDTTMEIEIVEEKATITLDSGFTLSTISSEAPIIKNVYGSNLSVVAGDEDHALQMQVVLKRGFSAQVKFGNQVIADLQFT